MAVGQRDPVLSLAEEARAAIRERMGALRAGLDAYDIDVAAGAGERARDAKRLEGAETAEGLRELMDIEDREREAHVFIAAAFLRVVEREDRRYEEVLRRALERYVENVG